MKSLEEQLSIYQRYHRHPTNRLTHFFGVPLIMFSLFLLLGLVRLQLGSIGISAASVLAIVVLAYYFRLDVVLAVAMTIFTAVLLLLANRIGMFGTSVSLTVFAVTFVGGWVLQLIGHAYEGRRPALVDNLFQIVIAPLFLMAEVFFALGYKRDIAERIARAEAR